MGDKFGLDDEAYAEVEEVFGHFDRNRNGTMEASEFSALLDALGADLSDAELAAGLAAVDSNGNGVIEFDEFVRWWADR